MNSGLGLLMIFDSSISENIDGSGWRIPYPHVACTQVALDTCSDNDMSVSDTHAQQFGVDQLIGAKSLIVSRI